MPEQNTTRTGKQRHLRVFLGDCDAPDSVLAAIREACKADTIGWYAVEELKSLPVNDHPRNPGLTWVEIEGAE